VARAAVSLSRLWQQQGKRGAARALLTEVYGGCTEGFDTTDLQAAETLLQALGYCRYAQQARAKRHRLA
jgi:hypothetical protein